MKFKELLEKLAELEHDQWMHWATGLMQSEELSKERKQRWKKYLVPYINLDEETKEFDRIWARKVIKIINDLEVVLTPEDKKLIQSIRNEMESALNSIEKNGHISKRHYLYCPKCYNVLSPTGGLIHRCYKCDISLMLVRDAEQKPSWDILNYNPNLEDDEDYDPDACIHGIIGGPDACEDCYLEKNGPKYQLCPGCGGSNVIEPKDQFASCPDCSWNEEDITTFCSVCQTQLNLEFDKVSISRNGIRCRTCQEKNDSPNAKDYFLEACQRTIYLLWKLLDDIDTLDDACKGDDSAFRKQVYNIQQMRWQFISEKGIDELYEQFQNGKKPNRSTDKPTVITLCGSSRFTKQMLIKQWELTKEGYIVMSWCALPDDYYQGDDKTHIGDQEGVKEFVDENHKRKIDISDEILVLNIDGYIEESTRSEIDYAVKMGKVVKYLEQPK